MLFTTKATITNSNTTLLLPNESNLDDEQQFYSATNNKLSVKLSDNVIANNESTIELTIRKLINLGLDKFIEEKILAFKNILSKIKGYVIKIITNKLLSFLFILF